MNDIKINTRIFERIAVFIPHHHTYVLIISVFILLFRTCPFLYEHLMNMKACNVIIVMIKLSILKIRNYYDEKIQGEKEDISMLSKELL